MNSTTLAQHQAHVAGAARPCGVFAFGHQWRNRTGSMMATMSINATATKRTTRHLGMLTT